MIGGMAGKRTAIVVPGHGDVDPEGTHRITRRCLRLVHEAERLVTAGGADVVVFSGWSSTGGPSEAEQMRDAWSGPDVELVVEPTARNTAENACAHAAAACASAGSSARVVVCAPTHLARTRLLFGRLYRGAGVEVAFRSVAVAPSLRSIAWELAAFPFLPAQLRAARAELARRPR